MSYHLRRLRLHGLIQRIPTTHRYRLTSFGLRTIVFCTRAYTRVFRTGLGSVCAYRRADSDAATLQFR
jgi:hypothetical protein